MPPTKIAHPGRLSMRSPFTLAIAATAALGGFSAPAAAADFYAGKTIEFTVGADVAGGYDIYARAIARHLPRFIPGHPTIVVKNLPGAGSGKAAAYIYAVAPKDGTAIGALMPGAIMGPLLEDRAQDLYDPTKFQYLGTADSGTRVCATFTNSKIKTFADAQREKTIMGASQAGGSTRDYVNMHRKTSGAKLDLVTGYKGTADIGLAMERGEVDGLCGWDWASLKSQKPDWVRDNKINILVQVGMEPDPELTKRGVPQVWTYIAKDEDKKAVELVVSQQVFGRPYIAPPGTPAEQVKILRDAFEAVMKDKEFLADAEKARIDITASNGAKVQQVVEKLYATPPATIERAKELIKD
jgi:tripartite-type tricarboxylate transporter receptor subunit TctC